MMPKHSPRELRQLAERDIEDQYHREVGHMNRAERRTEKGKRLAAEAKLRAREAELKLLKESE